MFDLSPDQSPPKSPRRTIQVIEQEGFFPQKSFIKKKIAFSSRKLKKSRFIKDNPLY